MTISQIILTILIATFSIIMGQCEFVEAEPVVTVRKIPHHTVLWTDVHIIGDDVSSKGSDYVDFQVEACDYLFTFTFKKSYRLENPVGLGDMIGNILTDTCDTK